MSRSVFLRGSLIAIAYATVAYFAMFWVMAPIIGTQGLSTPGPAGLIDLVNRCNPFRLIPPTWFIHDDNFDEVMVWMYAEAGARVALIAVGVATATGSILIAIRTKKRTRQDAKG